MMKPDNNAQQKKKESVEEGLGQYQPGFGPQIIHLIGELCGELKSGNYATCTALWAFLPYLRKHMIDGEDYSKIIYDAQEKKSEVQIVGRIENFISALYDQLRKDFLVQDVKIDSYIRSLSFLRGSTSPAPGSSSSEDEYNRKLDSFVTTVIEVNKALQNEGHQNSGSSVPGVNSSKASTIFPKFPKF